MFSYGELVLTVYRLEAFMSSPPFVRSVLARKMCTIPSFAVILLGSFFVVYLGGRVLDIQDWCSFQEWLSWFQSIRLPVMVKFLLEGVFAVAWWSIWRFRNRTIFEENPPKRSVVFDDIVLCSFNWCNSRCRRRFSCVDWLKNPHLISL